MSDVAVVDHREAKRFEGRVDGSLPGLDGDQLTSGRPTDGRPAA